jgi:hypothetical protein
MFSNAEMYPVTPIAKLYPVTLDDGSVEKNSSRVIWFNMRQVRGLCTARTYFYKYSEKKTRQKLNFIF